ncbi:hypothetical protein RvY_16321 [Ramazzottius varieornatus]|uniref:Uncharacterized protein n=1 Tax=Ramazzottius varieornatus TaxID=947166 RepID=A0A1D1VY14_RAMVA|nr:hypothetical protein RvY_16321 [Ramazzottius varieornatus]
MVKELKKLQLLQNLTRDLNENFGLLILLDCMRDMMAVVAMISLCLRVDDKQGFDESDAAYAARVQAKVNQSYWDFTVTTSALANAACVLGLFMMGIMVTYAILVYQARDEKKGAEDNVKTSDLQRQTLILLSLMYNGSKCTL